MDWFKIENEIGNIPLCLKTILNATGYDSLASIAELSDERISELQEYITNHERSVVNCLTCCHSEKYKTQNQFMFLPGHRTILQILPEIVKKILTTRPCDESTSVSQSHSVILAELIKTSQTNSQRDKNHAEYGDIIKDFFTYIYLLSDKCCYETMNANLPIPSTKTICKCK